MEKAFPKIGVHSKVVFLDPDANLYEIQARKVFSF